MIRGSSQFSSNFPDPNPNCADLLVFGLWIDLVLRIHRCPKPPRQFSVLGRKHRCCAGLIGPRWRRFLQDATNLGGDGGRLTGWPGSLMFQGFSGYLFGNSMGSMIKYSKWWWWHFGFGGVPLFKQSHCFWLSFFLFCPSWGCDTARAHDFSSELTMFPERGLISIERNWKGPHVLQSQGAKNAWTPRYGGIWQKSARWARSCYQLRTRYQRLQTSFTTKGGSCKEGDERQELLLSGGTPCQIQVGLRNFFVPGMCLLHTYIYIVELVV